ncbi:MAG: hypothetical protein RLZZ519_1410 [Bacteroidota bacterium]
MDSVLVGMIFGWEGIFYSCKILFLGSRNNYHPVMSTGILKERSDAEDGAENCEATAQHITKTSENRQN